MANKYLYLFSEGNANMRELLGGKGANLAEMTNIGLPVPQGFTITTEACTQYYEDGEKINDEIQSQIMEYIAKLEEITGKKFGDKENPLLVSVRSGARASMPGMMDTILNLGLNEDVVKVLAEKSGNPRWAYDCYRRFIQMYSDVVMEVGKKYFEELIDKMKEARGVTQDVELTADDLKELAEQFKAEYKEKVGDEFPTDPKEQLMGAVKAVFRSWNNPRAIVYRRMNDIPGSWGTPVNVQVQRGDQLLDFVVDRAVVHVNWVNSCMLDGDVGYISLYEFSGDCSPSFAVHLDNLMSQGAKALVIDLRDNPGGWVDDAQKVADMFLEEGNVASLVYRDGTTELYTTTTDGKENPIPLVVLVNEYSASASEILAGALQDRSRATIVGTQTFGKGVVQYVLPVGTRGAGMQLTVAQYYTPNGNEVHKVGITPDIEATLPEGDTTMYDIGDLDDAQLKKAYEVALDLIEP